VLRVSTPCPFCRGCLLNSISTPALAVSRFAALQVGPTKVTAQLDVRWRTQSSSRDRSTIAVQLASRPPEGWRHQTMGLVLGYFGVNFTLSRKNWPAHPSPSLNMIVRFVIDAVKLPHVA